MIPKKIFFLWFGDNKPTYVNYAIDVFKTVNPDFKIDLIQYDIDTINNIENQKVKNKYDECLITAINSVLEKNTKYESYISFVKRCLYMLKFIQRVVDVYKLELMNEFGGIYLDCDTFPNKPFDDDLINRESFIVNRYYKDYNPDERTVDTYFMGASKSRIIDSIWNFKTYVPVGNKNESEDPVFIQKKKDFFDCKLKYNYDKDNYYITHYNDFTWKPDACRTPLCKYDDLIKK